MTAVSLLCKNGGDLARANLELDIRGLSDEANTYGTWVYSIDF